MLRAGTARGPVGKPIPLAVFAAKICVVALFVFEFSGQAVDPVATTDPQRCHIWWTLDSSDTNKIAVEVSGLAAATLEKLRQSQWKPAEWQRLFAVYAEQGDLIADVGLPSMLGSYRVEKDVLRFEPQFPLEPGVQYRCVFHPDRLPGGGRSDDKLMTAVFQLPRRRPASTTTVKQVYPSAEVLPENLLKFYVHFSASMSRGRIYDHIHLRDGAGKEIELPFLEIDEELWNADMTRLTLFIDPGRIKRGVLPLEEIGPALEAGKQYTLVIDREWKDGSGNPLKETFQKIFRVGSADREPPEPAHWKIQPPKSETRERLNVTFPEPMDHALAQRVIRVVNEAGEPQEGQVALEDQERRWSLLPKHAWRRGSHRLLVQTTIEDLAGNNIGKPFEVDLFEGVQRRLTNSSVTLPFEVR